MSAVIVHLLAMLLLALIPWGDFSDGDYGEGDQILIGQLSRQQLVEMPEEKLQEVELESPLTSDSIDSLQSDLQSPLSSDMLAVDMFDSAVAAPSVSGRLSFEIESPNDESVLAGGSEDFGKLVSRLKRDGLDIVIVFDSSGSMQGEIDVVKNQIQRIGGALYRMIPRTRLGLCTYRDRGDEYVVKGLPLSDDLGTVTEFLVPIVAAGGGDKPEAVDAGLDWAVNKNTFRRSARKIILLFGDAPPHAATAESCQRMASTFRARQRGIVSTVTCRNESPMPEFVSIATAGGGESFLTRNEREIVRQLMILVFGSQHRQKVIEAFDLMRN